MEVECREEVGRKLRERYGDVEPTIIQKIITSALGEPRIKYVLDCSFEYKGGQPKVLPSSTSPVTKCVLYLLEGELYFFEELLNILSKRK